MIENLFDNCEKIKSNKKCDVLLLFHELNLEGNQKISNYIIENCKRYPLTRFATGYYFSFDNAWFSTKYKLYLKDFDKNDGFTFREVKMNQLKDEIICLTWNNQSKLVINIGREKNLNEFFQTKSNTLLDEMNILFANYSGSDPSGIFYLLSNIIYDISYLNFFKELIFLKRHKFKCLDEYLNEKETKLYKYSQFDKENAMFQIHIKICNRYSINNFDLNNCFDNGCNYSIYFESKTIKPSINTFVKSGFFQVLNTSYLIFSSFETKYIWLEIIDNEESIMRILNIHLTAKSYIDKFKILLDEKNFRLPLINVSKVGLGRCKDLLFYANFVNLDSTYINIQKQDCQTNDIMDAIAHFSYEISKGSLVVFDIRPIKTNNSILITEPIIFSNIPNTFSSSDLGLKGIEQFKANHKCNTICKELKFEKLI